MDSFMDKLAQKIGTQDVIRANAEAEAKELENAKAKVQEYEQLLAEMRRLNLKCIETNEKTSQLVSAGIEKMENWSAPEAASFDGSEFGRDFTAEFAELKAAISATMEAVQANSQAIEAQRQLIEANRAELSAQKEALETQGAAIEAIKASVEESKSAVLANRSALIANSELIKGTSETLERNTRNVESGKLSIEESKNSIVEAITMLQKNNEILEANKEALEANKTALAENRDAINAQEEFNHKENVRVYRNVQAALIDELKLQTDALGVQNKELEKKINAVKTPATASFVFSLISMLGVLGAAAYYIITSMGLF